MHFDSKNMFSKELLPNENILWLGKPSLKKNFTKIDFFLVPFGLFWGGFAVFWFIAASIAGGAFSLFGLPFVIIGVYITFGRFYIKIKNKKNTYYVITNMRILIVKSNADGIKKNFTTVDIKSIPSESVSCDKKGFGTIIFGVVPFARLMYLNTGMDFLAGVCNTDIVAFFDIDECEKVLRIYRNAKYQ